MPRINLLPWREEDRKRRQREFGIATAGAVVVAVGAVLLTMFAYSQMIDDQKSRNQRLTDEIVELEKSIKEIDGLERQKERLLARMEIIEQLQKSRPEVVHLFDEVARQLPEGVYLTGLKQTGARVEIRGFRTSDPGGFRQPTCPPSKALASGSGRAMALEIMVPNAAIRNLIREDKVHQIYSQMQIGQSKHGMQTLN